VQHGNYKYLCSELYKASSEFELSLSDIKMVVKFTRQQIERFNDGIEYCLEDEDCASILQEFLLHTYKKDNLTRAFNLWTLANKNSMLTDEIQDLIDEVDDFQRGDMDKMNPHEQIEYVKRECCRLLAQCLKQFIAYLRKNHQK
jgi:hypothetical protein